MGLTEPRECQDEDGKDFTYIWEQA